MPSIEIVEDGSGESRSDGFAGALLRAGPADGQLLRLPTQDGMPCDPLRLQVDGELVTYYRTSPVLLGKPWRYFWDETRDV